MSLLVETIKSENGKLLNIRFHNERMIRSLYGIFGFKKEIDLDRLIEVPSFAEKGLFKCRVLYDNRTTSVEFVPYLYRSIRSLKLLEADYLCYPYKYVSREKFEALMEKRGECDDILIVKNGMITDTSFSNVIFMNFEGEWVTPSTCLLPGTRRASLLHQGLIHESPIGIGDMNKYAEVKLINAMIGIEDTEGIKIRNIL